MTSVNYSDSTASSRNQSYTVTAQSPFNGAILNRNGIDPRLDFQKFWPCNQNDFRYQLVDDRQQVIWERWQPADEGSPGEILVSDWGDVIIRTHGCTPSLIAVQKDGMETKLSIVGDDWAKYMQLPPSEEQPSFEVDLIAQASSGSYWTANSWPYFTEVIGKRLFVWRTGTGQRIVFDLQKRLWLSRESTEYVSLQGSLDAIEKHEACVLLEDLALQRQKLVEVFRDKLPIKELEIRLAAKLCRMTAAALIVGRFNVQRAVPYLQVLEELDRTTVLRSLYALSFFQWVEVQGIRLIIQQSLRLMGTNPVGFSPYYLRRKGKRILLTDQARINLRARPDKCIEYASKLNFWSCPRHVVGFLGTPDYVENDLFGGGKWRETWEYDYCVDRHGIEKHGKTVKIHWKHFGMFWSRLSSVEVLDSTRELYAARLREILSNSIVTL